MKGPGKAEDDMGLMSSVHCCNGKVGMQRAETGLVADAGLLVVGALYKLRTS